MYASLPSSLRRRRQETVQSESLLPVLEKHDSDVEKEPVDETDVQSKSGNVCDEDREMPQLTLYA